MNAMSGRPVKTPKVPTISPPVEALITIWFSSSAIFFFSAFSTATMLRSLLLKLDDCLTSYVNFASLSRSTSFNLLIVTFTIISHSQTIDG